MLHSYYESDLEPAHPIVITLAARPEAIDALPGAKRSSPRIMPDETKLALTDCASHGLVRPVTFQAVRHCFLPFWPVCISDALRLRGLSPTAQLSAGRARASKGGGTIIRRPRALRRVIEFARCDPAPAFVRRECGARSTRIRSSGTLGRRERPRDGWHFSGDGVRFLQPGERPRVWRAKCLISRLQADARHRSLTDGAAVVERRLLGR
jgi:hypothetical protein